MVTMFTPFDLTQTIEQAKSEVSSILAETNTLIVQKHSGGYEDTLWFGRGVKTNFRDSARFWLACILQQLSPSEPDTEQIHQILNRLRIDLTTQYEEISPEIFQTIIRRYSDFLTTRNIPHAYEWHGTIQQAMRICEEWNEVIIIGETEYEFVAFLWETSA